MKNLTVQNMLIVTFKSKNYYLSTTTSGVEFDIASYR